MSEEPAPAHQRRQGGVENPPPTGAKDADATLSWMSLSMRPSIPREEKQAMSWMTEKSGRGETNAMTVRLHLCATHPLSGLKMEMSLSNNTEL